MSYLLLQGAATDLAVPGASAQLGVTDLDVLADGRLVVGARYLYTEEGYGGVFQMGALILDADGHGVESHVKAGPFYVGQIDQSGVAALSNGGFAVGWTNTSGGGEYVQTFDASGTPVGAVQQVFEGTNARIGAYAALPDGGFIVASTGFGSFPAMIQRFGNDGLPIESATLVTEITTGSQAHFEEAEDGSPILTYNGASAALEFTTDGAAEVDGDIVVPGASNWTGMTALGSAGARLAYWNAFTGARHVIMAQVISETGSFGTAFEVSDPEAALSVRPNAVTLPDGSVAIVWVGRASGDGRDHDVLLMARIGLDGVQMGDTIEVSSAETNTIYGARPSVTVLEDGNLAVAWMQQGYLGQGFVYETRVQVVATEFSASEIEGNAKANTLKGTNGADVMRGKGKGDKLKGKDGDDGLYGDGGNDKLDGGDGDDHLDGGTGRDVLNGKDGDDTLLGGADSDTLKAGDGDDDLRGGDGNDKVFGGDGDDSIWGDDGKDKIDGGKGDDIIDGGAGNDSIKGGKGRDLIDAGSGKDTVAGGAGADTFLFRLGEGKLTVKDFELGTDFMTITGFGISAPDEAVVLSTYGSKQGKDYVLDFAITA